MTKFWLDKWRSHEIGFHKPTPNPLLVKNLPVLGLEPGDRVFLPLCGKTLDLGWLMASDLRVVGVELSELAIEQLFAEMGVSPQVCSAGELTRYSAESIDVFVGDVFELTAEMLGVVNAVYDRAALIALPRKLRLQYTSHVITISHCATQLIVSLSYDQSLMTGPPFSVTDAEIEALYAPHYELNALEQTYGDKALKEQWPATESVWLMESR